jgi:eukaryotic-like serine/threonine-protein kinase
MTGERWTEIQEIFDEAREKEPQEQSAFLNERCGADTALRQEVQALLDTDTGPVAYLKHPVGRLLEPVSGQEIGKYRILDEIARGGMAVVYRAVAMDDEYERPVALKLLKRGTETEVFVQRFQAEGQVLSGLQHPNIAKLLAGGTTGDARPYLVMEEIQGVPIDTFCREKELDLKDRLKLFLKVCDAVQHAHVSMVLHRDLKPANILVTTDGEPKLLDFGVAKLLTVPDRPGSPPTTLGERAMTKAYASPEQICGLEMGAASDVYSLGILLYELLTGRRPYELPTEGGLAKVQDTIQHTQPKPPSQVVGKDNAIPARLLKGDLDTIVEKALRKEPERRFQSVAELAEDLRRHVAGEPVTARPTTLGYRSGKFLRRYKWPVALAASLFLATLVFVGVLWKQQQETAQERDRAEASADFLTSLFAAGNPLGQNQGDWTVQQLLEHGANQLKTELAERPEIRARLLNTIALAFVNLAEYKRAEECLQEILSIHQETELDRKILGETYVEISNLHVRLDDLDKAQKYAEQTLQTLDTDHGPHQSVIASALSNLGLIFKQKGAYPDAEKYYLRSIHIREQDPAERASLARSLSSLGALYRTQGRFDEAEPLYRRALALKQTVHGSDHPGVAVTMSNYARLLKSMESFDEAERYYLEALRIQSESLGMEHPSYAQTLNNLGTLLITRGDPEGALEYLQDSLEIRIAVFGQAHLKTAESLQNVAVALGNLGRREESEQMIRKALAIRREYLGNSHILTAQTLRNLAGTLSHQGKHLEAQKYFDQALAAYNTIYSDPNSGIIHTNRQRAVNLAKLNDLEGARQSAMTAVQDSLELRPAGHWEILASQCVLGAILERSGQYAEAESLLVPGYKGLLTEPQAVGERSIALNALVRLYEKLKQPEEVARYKELLSQ